ncbi:MAG: N-acetylmuramoyl-L-alanine amidase, partial [Myxococcales bacterium]|nr:N-acetylmuramoyl-L-alanine amidase [Myxococcales bacterium]
MAILDPWAENEVWKRLKAKNEQGHLWICDKKYPIRAPTVTFKEKPEWSFEKARSSAKNTTKSGLFSHRRKKDGGHCKTIEDVKEVLKLLVIHSDVTWNSGRCFGVLVSRGFSTHVMLDYDGTLYQGLDLRDCAWHGGETNPISIGCDLNNRLDPDNHSSNYLKDAPDDTSDQAKPIYKRTRSPRLKINGSWKQCFGHTDAQYATMIQLIKFLNINLGLKTMPPMDDKGRIQDRELQDFLGFQGWIGHYHCKAGKWDPGPGFDWKRVISGVHGERNAWPADMFTRMEDLYGALVEAEAEKFYRNNERAEGGGYYPVGLSQTWHNGIHIRGSRRTPITSMVDGEIVAARFTDKTEIGHPNFVAMKHELPLPNDKKMTFFSLYMHLDNENLAKASTKLNWVTTLYDVDKGKDELKGLKKDEPKDEDADKKKKKKKKKKRRKGRKRRKKKRNDDTKVADAKKKKKTDKVEYDEPETLEVVDTVSLIPEIGNGLAALQAGKVARLSRDDKTRVKLASGSTIGYMGEFRDNPVLHVEVFAKDQIVDLDLHGKYWRVIDEEEGTDPFIDTEDIWKMFDDGSLSRRMQQDDFDPRHVLSSEDIVTFYNNDDPEEAYLKVQMRKTIARHISEWSRSIDWMSAIGKIQP